MKLIGSLLSSIFLSLSTLVAAICIVASAAVSKTMRFRITVRWAHINLWVVKKLCGVDYIVEGREHLARSDIVVYWKHQSTFETIALFTLMPTGVVVLKRELMWLPVVGWSLAVMGFIPIDRASGHSAVTQIVRRGTESLDRGRPVVIFPEGTRMAPGQTRRYGVSGAVLASKSGRPIIPIAHNAGDHWPRRGLRKNPGTIRVVIGPPIDTKGKKPARINEEVQEWIEGTMRTISDAYRDTEDGAGADNRNQAEA